MLKLRPHHILDIVRNIGNERPIFPHEYGHLLHVITEKLISDINTKCMLVIENDDICGPCKMLTSDQNCIDLLRQIEQPVSKQKYNDDLDKRVIDFLNLRPNIVLTIREYLVLVKNNMNDLVDICTHPKEDKENRKIGLIKGMIKLVIN